VTRRTDIHSSDMHNRLQNTHIKIPLKIKRKYKDGDHIFYSVWFLVELSCQARCMVICIIILLHVIYHIITFTNT
jgi:hypothetical protein